MAERLIAPVLKTDVPKGTGGSNPSPSASLRAINSAVRVPPLQGGSRGFESLIAHQQPH